MPRKKNKPNGWEIMRQERLEATKEQRAISAEKYRECRKKWKEQGRCVRCGSEKADDGNATCLECLLKIKLTRKSEAQKSKPYSELPDEQKERIKQSRRKKYQDRKSQGICVRCGQRKALSGLTVCGQCRIKRNQALYGYVSHSSSWYKKERKAGRL